MEPESHSASSPQTQSLPAVTFEKLTFSDGTVIALDPNDIVVLVGPNNAGKSVALRELEEHVGSKTTRMVIRAAALHRRGTPDELKSFLESHGRLDKRGEGALQIVGYRYNIATHDIPTIWHNDIGRLRQFFCMRMQSETRITDSNPQASISFIDRPPVHPIHILYENDDIADRIGSYFRRAFGEDLIVFHLGGKTIPLLTGQRPELKPREDRISTSYNERLRTSTVPLEQQGDGMRSFASVILHMLAPRTQSILLLDEPEAFLHPPQARLLGEFIARERPAHAQLFIATHSADVLQGLLNVAPEHLRVLRIQRDGNVNRVKELDKRHAKAISADPLMKFSSVMSGIFHQRVIVCESDADCMFYSSILDLPAVRGEQHPDVLFVHAGGKHRMASLCEALRALDVTVDVVADMDILNEEEVLKRVVETLGGEWHTVEGHARSLKKAIEQHKPWLTSAEVVKGVRGILDKAPTDGEFPKDLRAAINAVFRKASPWDAVKDAGQTAVPAGQATWHYQELRKLCSGLGLDCARW